LQVDAHRSGPRRAERVEDRLERHGCERLEHEIRLGARQRAREAVRDGNDTHPGRARGADAVWRVLEHDAIGRPHTEPVGGQEIRGVVGDDAVRELAQQAGVSEEEAADVLARVMPEVVNGLTPDGQLPSDDDLDQLVAKFGG